jgi:hypothetical protein
VRGRPIAVVEPGQPAGLSSVGGLKAESESRDALHAASQACSCARESSAGVTRAYRREQGAVS